MALEVSKKERPRPGKLVLARGEKPRVRAVSAAPSINRKLVRRAVFGTVVVGFFSVAIVTMYFTPPSMDEALQYHAIACSSHPVSQAQVYREPCGGSFDLQVWGHWLPLRSYHYVGAVSGWIYAPVLALFPFYPSARWLGLAYLLLVIWGIAKLARAPFVMCLAVAGMFSPLLLQVFCDTGPVGLQLVALVWLPLILRRTVLSKGPAFAAWTLLSTVMTFAAIEAKPFFLLALPALLGVSGALAFADLPNQWGLRKRVLTTGTKLWPTLFLVAGLCGLLFSARTRDGESYWQVLNSVGSRFAASDIDGQAMHLKLFFDGFLVDFTGFAHRLYERAGWGGLFATLAYWVMVFVVFGYAMGRGRRVRALSGIGLFLGATVCSTLVVNNSRSVASGHHYILLFPYFLVALVIALKKVRSWRARWAYCLAMAALQVATIATVVRRDPLIYASWERLEVFRQIERIPENERLVVAHVDWGTYYLQSLYSPTDQLVTYLEPLTMDGLEQLTATARMLNRKIAFVGRSWGGPNLEMIRRQLSNAQRVYPRPGAESISGPHAGWELWLASPD